MQGHLRFSILATVTLLLGTAGASVDARGLELVLVKDKANKTDTLYKESNVLVVTISQITDGWPSLRETPAPVPAPSAAKPADTLKDCAECPEMVVIPAGSFRMGDLNGGGDSEAKPVHTVTFPHSFAVGRYEVTRSEFAAFVDETGHSVEGGCYTWTGSIFETRESSNWRDPGFSQTDRDPVVCVNWNDAKAYVGWLSRKAGKAYRLPSEAEWEYVARAGTNFARYWGNTETDQCDYENGADKTYSQAYPKDHLVNSHCSDGYVYTSPVGSFHPNAFGLYDMLGNVREWVEDCWHKDYQRAPSDGGAWGAEDKCNYRVRRGASWRVGPTWVRPSSRSGRDVPMGFRLNHYGFRVARTFMVLTAALSAPRSSNRWSFR